MPSRAGTPGRSAKIAEYRTAWGANETWKACASVSGNTPCLNSIGLAPDRKSFVTAEFYRPAAAGGRVIRWPLNTGTGLPAGDTTRASEAYSSPIWHMQGVATDGKDFFLTGDCPGALPPGRDPNDFSCIHRAAPDQSPHVLTEAPPLTQNLSYWPKTRELWGINERINTSPGARVVFKITP